MFIPKSRMMVITAAIQLALDDPWAGCLTDEERETLNQVMDKAALVHNGDANFLEMEVCYAHTPSGHVLK